mmetsp:Transcript_5740/g.12691  ORF Transcript_5740/g.12691 Transcript_5740/m.12691 type:complete len:321 (+) Transcript_5740:149-1111(+)|eukprot:CAMPEP_0202910840 /NCGR_PEP_ID=MMETSP1392-20130828/53168_1 /ASSEMBLY_ACC=CAM_ASM_000868 /TAXON_ID=225041 /ORGANISM="Chlamydomonas chlamydogama, Strain SAG 11-48b" /LENGTH=320 /DNA_ID=CAMNT_0049601103 /DNA_START=72 /DNA_END=1034 /DNA_ORIENTATION=-
MAALRKALFSLFGGKALPNPEDLDDVARSLFKAIARPDPSSDLVVMRKDLYKYLVMHSEAGISARSVDKLFDRVDVNKDGSISEEEFVQVVSKFYEMLKNEQALEERLSKSIPDNHVIHGSCKMNGLSGTNAFRMQVVRRRSMKRLWDLFQEIDMDADGHITLAEFKKYISRRKPDIANMSTSIFYALDKMRTGTVNFKQLIEKMFPEASREDVKLLMRMARPKDYLPKARPDEQLLEEIHNIFKVYDDDHTGTLDEEEFTHAMNLTGFTEEEAANMFKEIDTDGSGEVSFEEFEFWYVNHQRQQAKVLADAEKDSDNDD